MIKERQPFEGKEIFHRPEKGTFTLQLGEHSYTFLNKTNLPFNWIDQAILGLTHIIPFNAYGITEDGYKTYCIVSLYNTHITKEPVGFIPTEIDSEALPRESHYVHMWNFCYALHKDMREHADAWTQWILSCDEYHRNEGFDTETEYLAVKGKLMEKLDALKKTLENSRDRFPVVIYCNEDDEPIELEEWDEDDVCEEPDWDAFDEENSEKEMEEEAEN